jgi:hypothetical protein
MFSFIGNIFAQGVFYVQPNPQPTYMPVVPQEINVGIDIDGDGTNDFTLSSHVNNTVTLTAQGANQFLIQSLMIAAIPFGTSIGSTTSGYTWSGGTASLCAVINVDNTPNLSEIGNFSGMTNGYIGFDLVQDGNNYYGWMQIQSSLGLDLGLYGSVTAWAYETSPNTPIFAGEVPEPSTVALLALFGIAVGLVRWKRSKR